MRCLGVFLRDQSWVFPQGTSGNHGIISMVRRRCRPLATAARLGVAGLPRAQVRLETRV